jgi:hypothetical protein
MKTSPRFFRRLATVIPFFAVLLSLGASSALALTKTNIVSYDPVSEGVTLLLPATQSYTLNVTCPAAVTTFPTTVTLRLAATNFPLGDAATALSYIHFSTPTLTFTSISQTLPVTVTMNFPASALSLAVPGGGYMYQIYTDGWPSGIIDNGSSISAGVSLPTGPAGNAPAVTINTPVDGTPLTFPVGGLPASIAFTYSASTDSSSPTISAITASFGTSTAMATIPVTTTGMGTAAVSGGGNFVVTAPGTYLLQVEATNSIGSASDTNTYPVTISAPPPTVTISSPVSGSTYLYRVGDSPTPVIFNFTAVSSYGGIRTLTAKLDGADQVFMLDGIGTLTATGSLQLSYATAGTHTIVVTTTDDNGTATAQSTFTISVVEPQIAVGITAPTPNQVFTIPVNASTVNVPYAFTTTTQNGFSVESVSATLGSTALTPTTVGLGTPVANSTGTLTLGAGTYTLTATGKSAGLSVSSSVVFTVKTALNPPTVVITTPPAGYTQAIVPGTTVAVPLTFTGTSNNPGTTITQLTATLDGTPVTVTSSTLGQTVATGTSTLSVSTSGTHHIVVTAKDSVGTATATRDFTITFLTPHKVTGLVFLDLDGDGTVDATDFGLASITVKLLGSNGQVVASTTTGPDGIYTFTGVFPGNYVVVTCPFAGLFPTTWPLQCVTMGSTDVTASPIGYRLDFCALQSMTANGYTIGYWKNNIDKAIAGKTSGTQVSAATLSKYTSNLAQFSLAPFDGLTMKSASATMGSTSSKAADLLAKQLLASEYNYQNGAYLNGNATLTYAFVSWGEAVLKNSNNFSSTYILWVKDWFDAYNNSHGGIVDGPDL